MDKRNLLFIITLFLSLFGISQYFAYERALEFEAYKKELAAWEAQEQARIEQDTAGRLVSADKLPIVTLSSDGETFQGILTGNQVIVASQDAPETVTYKHSELSRIGVAASSAHFFAENKDQAVQAFDLPRRGSHDLQLVTSDGSVSLGVLLDGAFSIPLEPPASDAVALAKTAKGFVPVGIYQADSGAFVGLKEVLGIEVAEVVETGTLPEQFYLLENNFQQLVFSNVGGSLVEINLPFLSEKNPLSAVREIEFDRDMVKKHAPNAYFPNRPVQHADGKIREEGELGGYYPLLRRNLKDDNGKTVVTLEPANHALTIVSSYPEVAELRYKVTHHDMHSITFEAVQRHRRITKTYRLTEGNSVPYMIDLSVRVDGDSRGLWLTTGVPEVELVSGSPAPALKSRLTRNQKTEVEALELPQGTTTVSSINPDWICNSNGFMGIILDPISDIDAGYRATRVDGPELPSRLVQIDSEHDRFPAANFPGYQMLLPLNSSGGTMNFRIFAGPFSSEILKQVDAVYASDGYEPDYLSSQTFHGWFSFISAPFSKLLFMLLNLFHTITQSWAASIVLLTVALRLMLYPLNSWSMRSMRRMQKIAPEVQAIQNKFKKDPKRAQVEIMNLYRERGANPMMGCFPMLIQMPFLIGMFDLLKSSFELRGAPFIPGWIDNLTAPDVLFNWGFPLPFFGSELHLLPLLLGGVMFVQQKMSATGPSDPSQMTEQQRQQKTMGSMMTVLFAVMFYHFPSGLNLYWLSSMGLGIVQQWWINKQLDSEDSKPVVLAAK